jgi:hypothetical protein
MAKAREKRIRVQFNERKLMWYKKDDEGNPDWSVHNETLASMLEEQSKRRDTDEMKLFKLLTFDRYSAISERQTIVKYFPNLLTTCGSHADIQTKLEAIFNKMIQMMVCLGRTKEAELVNKRWESIRWRDYEREKLLQTREHRLFSALLDRTYSGGE